jgi:4-hydroxy-tetrahydrodipicolinate synthase
VADASPVPVLMYNIPGRTASNITAETTLKLAEHKNIIGTKEASGNLEQCMKISKYMSKDFLLLSGDDMQTVALYAIGGKGVISVLANVFPQVFRKMKEYSFGRQYDKASQQLFKLLEINGPMYEEGNPVGIKFLLETMGICSSYVRLPLVPASLPLQKKIQSVFESIKK